MHAVRGAVLPFVFGAVRGGGGLVLVWFGRGFPAAAVICGFVAVVGGRHAEGFLVVVVFL